MESLQFNVLSANAQGLQIKHTKLHFLSETITLDQIDSRLEKIRNEDNTHPIVIVMFHEYNFSKQLLKEIKKPEITLQQLSSLLSRLKKKKDIHIQSLQQAHAKLLQGNR